MKSYYDILGVSKTASEDEIRSAFRSLVKKFHPDINPSPDAVTRFIEIQKAYEVLIDYQQRMRYDTGQRLSYKVQDATPHVHPRDRGRRAGSEDYHIWLMKQQILAKKREQQKKEQEYANSPLFRGLNSGVNIAILLIMAFVVIVPMRQYYLQQFLPESKQRPFIFFLIPMLLGLLFIIAGSYYWFGKKTNNDNEKN